MQILCVSGKGKAGKEELLVLLLLVLLLLLPLQVQRRRGVGSIGHLWMHVAVGIEQTASIA